MKKLALFFSIVLISIISYHYITLANMPTFLNVPFLSQSEVEDKIENLTLVTSRTIGQLVYFEDTTLLYDASTDCHFITIGSQSSGNFETKGGIALYWIGEFDDTDAALAITNNEAFSLLAIYNGTYEIISLKISTLPLVSFSSAQDLEIMTIINPDDIQTNRYTTSVYNMTYKIRGATSSILPKTPYKVSLIDENGDRAPASLFGLRSDDDWNFNAVYGDSTRIREAATLDLLQQMTDTAETATLHPQDGQFCELFIDDLYYGIYQVLEPMDTQQSEIDEDTDYLYKAGSYFNKEDLTSALNALEDDNQSPVPLESYPENDIDTRYDPLIDYYAFLAGDSEITIAESSLEEISAVLDIENLIDISIANTVFSLWDNVGKNFMLVLEQQADGSYLARRELFDFNYSFGDGYAYSEIEGEIYAFTKHVSASGISTDDVFQLFSNAACYDEFIALYQARYAELRENVLSEENMLATLDDYYITLYNSGAYLRDTAHWSIPYKDTAGEYELLADYTIEHLAAVDEYVDKLF